MFSSTQIFVLFFESISVFMFVFFLIQYLIIKKKEYLCYSLYLLLLSFYYLVALPEIFFKVNIDDVAAITKFDLYKRPAQFLSSVLYSLFVVYYLGLEKIDGYLYRFFRILIIMYIVLAIACFALNLAGVDYNNAYYIFSLLLFPLQLYVVIALFKHKVPYANFIIWGSIVTLVGSSLTLIYYIYLVKYDVHNMYMNAHSYIPVQVSILIDMFLFSIALQRKIADNEKSLIYAAHNKQQAVLLERERIIADLHDDVGGGLSSIRMMSDLMAIQGKKESLEKYVSFGQKISFTAKDIAQRMHTIIWSLNAENDTVENFAEYVRQYGVGFFENAAIGFKSNIMAALPENIEISGVKRKNLFLIVKEAFHNIIKHSGATQASVNITMPKDILHIDIADNGKGIPGDINSKSIKFGNGLKNMQKRMDEIGGTVHISSSAAGTVIKIAIRVNG